jgi:8-oxo-dGTP pyrophosphatase MutT (NUDIX family)
LNGTSPSTSSRKSLQVCLLRHPLRNEILLPKGRKDRGESLEVAALRETFEETGYPPRLLPVAMHTRAPDPAFNLKDGPPGVFLERCVEPFLSTIRHVGERNWKFIYWFTGVVDEDTRWDRDQDGEVLKVEGTMTDSECFESGFVDVDDEGRSAVDRLTFENDREVVRTAIQLVRATYGT